MLEFEDGCFLEEDKMYVAIWTGVVSCHIKCLIELYIENV